MIIYPLPPQELDDKTLLQQIKAIAQTLCNVHHSNVLKHHYDEWIGIHSKIPLFYANFKNSLELKEWASTCRANYKQLVEMGLACYEEYRYRYRFNDNPDYRHKELKLLNIITWARDNIPDLWIKLECVKVDFQGQAVVGMEERGTPFPLVMPEKYKQKWTEIDGELRETLDSHLPESDIIESYRSYYRSKITKFYKRCEEQHDCCLYANKGKYCIRQNLSTWTRRNKPTWLDK